MIETYLGTLTIYKGIRKKIGYPYVSSNYAYYICVLVLKVLEAFVFLIVFKVIEYYTRASFQGTREIFGYSS